VASRVKRVSVLIADDHCVFRRVVCRLLAPHFEIVGEAADVVVLDVAMPCLSGIEVARQLAEAGVPSAVVFLSVVEDVEIVEAALDAGGRAFVVKARLAADLEPAVRAAFAGERFVSAGLSSVPRGSSAR
jgi:DNA-binding NarL/FixJ family response regulator